MSIYGNNHSSLASMQAEIMAADGFEEIFNVLKEAPLRTFAADSLLDATYKDPTVLERFRELKVEKWDLLMEQVARQPTRDLPKLDPPSPPLSPRLQELLDQVEFDDSDDEEEGEEGEEEEESDSSDSEDGLGGSSGHAAAAKATPPSLQPLAWTLESDIALSPPLSLTRSPAPVFLLRCSAAYRLLLTWSR